MATLPSPINGVAVLQANGLHLETPQEGNADWEELIEMVRDTNELVRLARALIAGE
jgi:hypothetical protein